MDKVNKKADAILADTSARTKEIITLSNLKHKFFDNLFSANHRNTMIATYGYTEAMRITINDLIA